MRRLAVWLWAVAGVLALLIWWQLREPASLRGATVQMPVPELQLWRAIQAPALPAQAGMQPAVVAEVVPAPAVASPPVSPPVSPPAAAPEPGACARLGIFPNADWATQVGQLLLPAAEQHDGLTWAVKAYPGQRYYVVFNGLDADALAQRLLARKALLRRRVSASAHPESCS